MPTVPQAKPVKPKKHHGYSVFLFALGTLFPPLGPSLFLPSLRSYRPFPQPLPPVSASEATFGLISSLPFVAISLVCHTFHHTTYLLTPSTQATVTTFTFKISATIRIIAALHNGRSATASSIPPPSNVRNAAHSGQAAMKNAIRSRPTRTDRSRRVRFRMQRALVHPPT